MMQKNLVIKIAEGEDSHRTAQMSVAGSRVNGEENPQRFYLIFILDFSVRQSVVMQRLTDVWIESSPDPVLIPALRHKAC